MEMINGKTIDEINMLFQEAFEAEREERLEAEFLAMREEEDAYYDSLYKAFIH
jgi:hypothetical protein